MNHIVRKATVVLLIDEYERVCLARKKQPIHDDTSEISYSLGMYNGYGGKQEAHDLTIYHTAVRECYDESGVIVVVEDLEDAALVYFSTKNDLGEFKPFMEVYFFFVRVYAGVPHEGAEMGEPFFFKQKNIPYTEMMPADGILFRDMFAGKRNIYEVKLHGKDAPPEVIVTGKLK